MKRVLVFSMLCTALLLPCTAPGAGEMTKEEAARFLQKVVQSNVRQAGQAAVEDTLKKINPKGVAAYKKLAGVIANSELAASLCWDLIQLGLQTNRAKFAKEFAMRLRKYIPSEYVEGAELFGGMSEKLIGWRIINEADCTSILYELGKNTYDAITKMSGYDKQKAVEAGHSIENFSALMIGIGGTTGRQWQSLFRK